MEDRLDLILSWESAFNLQFNHEEVLKLRTPQAAIDPISTKLDASSDRIGICPTLLAYHSIRQAFQSVAGLQRHEIRLDQKLRVLLPKNQRREAWKQIHMNVGTPKFPQLGFGVGIIFTPITVQDLVDWTVARYPYCFLKSDGFWTRSQVRSVVRAVIRDCIGVSDFGDESDFVQGMRID
jgi:hypothetical protein